MKFALLFVACAACAQDLDSLENSALAAYAAGDFAGAQQSLGQAWDLAQRLPDSDPKRYEILKLLSRVTSAAGDWAGAENWVELAINWREVNVARDDPKLAGEWTELAALCLREKDFFRAVELLRQAMRSDARVFGEVSSQVADDLSRIALVYMGEKQPQEAAPMLARAIDVREQALGAENPAILSDLDRLAAVRLSLREYDKAELAFRRSLVIRERLLGPNDSGLIESVEGLAYAQFGEKKYDQAEAGYKRLLELWLTATADPAHPMIALTLDKLANFYRETQRWDEGTEAAQKALAVRQLFLANGYWIESAARQEHGDGKVATQYLAAALAALDPMRDAQNHARQAIQAALSDLESGAGNAPKK